MKPLAGLDVDGGNQEWKSRMMVGVGSAMGEAGLANQVFIWDFHIFEVPIIYLSGGIKKAVRHTSPPQREGRRTGFGCPQSFHGV